MENEEVKSTISSEYKEQMIKEIRAMRIKTEDRQAAEERRTEAINRLADAMFALASKLEALPVQNAPEKIKPNGFTSVTANDLPF